MVHELEAATEALPSHANIDLEDCTFIDSSGLGWLIGAKSTAEARGGSITLIAPSAPVTRLLRICGLANHFAVEDRNETPSSDA